MNWSYQWFTSKLAFNEVISSDCFVRVRLLLSAVFFNDNNSPSLVEISFLREELIFKKRVTRTRRKDQMYEMKEQKEQKERKREREKEEKERQKQTWELRFENSISERLPISLSPTEQELLSSCWSYCNNMSDHWFTTVATQLLFFLSLPARLELVRLKHLRLGREVGCFALWASWTTPRAEKRSVNEGATAKKNGEEKKRSLWR